MTVTLLPLGHLTKTDLLLVVYCHPFVAKASKAIFAVKEGALSPKKLHLIICCQGWSLPK